MVKMSMKDINSDLAPQELAEIETAAIKTPEYDEDSPEMSEEMLQRFKRVNQASRTKQAASIRLSPKAQAFFKSVWKGLHLFLQPPDRCRA